MSTLLTVTSPAGRRANSTVEVKRMLGLLPPREAASGKHGRGSGKRLAASGKKPAAATNKGRQPTIGRVSDWCHSSGEDDEASEARGYNECVAELSGAEEGDDGGLFSYDEQTDDDRTDEDASEDDEEKAHHHLKTSRSLLENVGQGADGTLKGPRVGNFALIDDIDMAPYIEPID